MRKTRRGSGKGSHLAPYVVVAADGAWIRHSYESAYQGFVDAVAEPGRPLGYLFLDKLFQLTVEVPSISPTAQEAYLRGLLNRSAGGPDDPTLVAEAGKTRVRIEESKSE